MCGVVVEKAVFVHVGQVRHYSARASYMCEIVQDTGGDGGGQGHRRARGESRRLMQTDGQQGARTRVLGVVTLISPPSSTVAEASHSDTTSSPARDRDPPTLAHLSALCPMYAQVITGCPVLRDGATLPVTLHILDHDLPETCP